MSIIDTKNDLYYERERLQNYAAEYAKRECDSMRATLEAHIESVVIDHPDGSVTTAKLADGAVNESKIEDKAVTEVKLADGAVTESKIADYSITADKFSDTLMETIDIAINTAETANLTANTAYETANSAITTANSANNTAVSAAADASIAKDTADFASETAKNSQTTADLAMEVASQANNSAEGITVAVNALSDDISNLTDQFNKVGIYTATPQKVGTWVDGTPVWRVVVERAITDSERSEGHIYFNEEDLHFSEYVGVATGAYINGYAYVTYSDGGVGEGVILTPFEPFTFTYGGEIPADYTKVISWVEFATPEENLNL